MIADIFKRKIDSESKVERVVDEASTLGQASLRIIAKNTLTFITIARNLRALNGAFSNLVKLYGITPAEGGKLNDLKKELSSQDDMKVARVRVAKERREKPRTFMASVLDKILKLIFAAVVGTLLAIGYVTYKLVEIVTPYVSSFIDTVTNTVSAIGDAIVNFYKETDFADLFLTGFKKYLGFISFGIISESDVDDALSQAGSFYKTVIGGIGEFLKDAISWLAPKLQAIGRIIGRDVLGIDIDKLSEKRKAKDEMIKESQRLEKEYSDLDKKRLDLTKKKDDLSAEVKKKQEQIQKNKQEEEKKKAEEEEKKKGSFFSRLFKKEEKKKEEVKPTPAPTPEVKKEEVKPVAKKEEVKPTPKKEEVKPTPKVDVAKVPPDNGSKAPLPEPAKEEKKPTPSTADTKPKNLSTAEGEKVMIAEMNKQGIKDSTMRAAIMAQVGHESGNFTRLSENLYYSASGLLKTFKKYFPTEDMAKEYQKNPQKIADRVYGGRMGNKPEGSGEGFLYRGRGFIQLTGKNNYKKFGYISDPDALLNPEKAAEGAIKYMLPYKGAWDDIKKVTQFVNGGYIGLDDRQKHFQAYLNDPKIIGSDISASSSSVAKDQREQSKPQNPTVVNAHTTNNNVAQKNRNLVAAKA